MKSSIKDSQSQLIELDSDHYEVQQILNKRNVRGGKKEYLIKWKNWDSIHNTWQPIENLHTCLDSVKEFDLRFTNKILKPTNEVIKKGKPIQKQRESLKSKSKRLKPSQQSESDSQPLSRNKLSQSQVKKQKILTKQVQKRRQQKQKPAHKNQKQKFELKIPQVIKLQQKKSLKMQAQTHPSKQVAQFIIKCINYHIVCQQNGKKEIYYNVDLQSRKTGNMMPVRDIKAQVLLKQNVHMVVQYLEDYAMEIDRIERRNFDNNK